MAAFFDLKHERTDSLLRSRGNEERVADREYSSLILGLDVQRLRSGRARIVSGDSTEYVELKSDKGILVVKERIDREQLCAEPLRAASHLK